MRPAANLDRWDHMFSVREGLRRAAGFKDVCQLPFRSTGPVGGIVLHSWPESIRCYSNELMIYPH